MINPLTHVSAIVMLTWTDCSMIVEPSTPKAATLPFFTPVVAAAPLALDPGENKEQSLAKDNPVSHAHFRVT